MKKGKYIYYRCAKPCENVVYLPENKLALQLGEALRRIRMTPEIVEWTREALLSSHADQAERHDATVTRLEARRAQLASYLDTAYIDRLEGRIPQDVWERRSAEWDAERRDIDRQLAALGKRQNELPGLWHQTSRTRPKSPRTLRFAVPARATTALAQRGRIELHPA